MITNWSGVAFNHATDSSNRIHADDVAQQFGFKGGLVPGVTVSAYTIHPAVVAWGEDWLTRGSARVVVHKPLYHGFQFEVLIRDQGPKHYAAELIDQEGTHCATATVGLLDTSPEPPVMRGDPILERDEKINPATPEEMARLKEVGMKALRSHWHKDTRMATYLETESGLPDLLKPSKGAYANMGYLLGTSNWVLAGNAYMNPWIHLQTQSQQFAPVPDDTYLISECAITDLFNKKGHEFVDVEVNIFKEADKSAVCQIQLRAIYKLRGL